MLPPEEALAALLKALPRCCNCGTSYAVIIDMYRWPLCETCWRAVPGSDDEKPTVDMREAVRAANSCMRASLANSLSRLPSVHEIPPPSSPPESLELKLEELSYRNKKLRVKIRRMREVRVEVRRRTAVNYFAIGFITAILLFGFVHYM